MSTEGKKKLPKDLAFVCRMSFKRLAPCFSEYYGTNTGCLFSLIDQDRQYIKQTFASSSHNQLQELKVWDGFVLYEMKFQHTRQLCTTVDCRSLPDKPLCLPVDHGGRHYPHLPLTLQENISHDDNLMLTDFHKSHLRS